MHARLRMSIVAGTVLSVAQAALAEVAPGGWVDTRIVGTELEMRDVTTGRPLIGRETLSLFSGFPAGVTTDVTPVPTVDGADLRFTFRNPTGSAKKLGRIYLGIINLGEDIEYFNFRHTSDPVPAHATTHVGWGALYPDDLYSPVAVLRNSSIAVGMSMQYPVMDYKHDCRIEISSPGNWLADGEAGRGWQVSFGLANINQESPWTRLEYEGQLQPGEERVYTLSVRFTKTPGEWQSTLTPYRDYFRGLYGPVKYERQTTPVLGYALADPGNISAINPQGYRANHRPDLNGFAGVIRELNTYANWPTIMLWCPTGLYRNHRDLNWPYQFASHWNVSPQQQTAFSAGGFPSLVARGQTLGMWWGRSLGLAEQWDTAEYTRFNPDDTTQRQVAFRELDAAAQAGATWIGLDTFAHHITPVWQSRQWLRDMQARHPDMHFVTEPSMCDIMHVEAPTFISGWNEVTSRPANRSGLFNITHPNYLADFLLPGHETWGAYRYAEHNRYYGPPSDAQVRADMQYVASMGYRPCFMIDYFTPQGIQAAPTWESSVPATLRNNDPWILDIREGRRPGQAAQQPTEPTGGDLAGGESGSQGGGQGGSSGDPLAGSGGSSTGDGAAPGAGGDQGAGEGSQPQRPRSPGQRAVTSSSQRRSVIRVQTSAPTPTPGADSNNPAPESNPSAGGSPSQPGTGAQPPRRVGTNWREMLRRNSVFRVQRPATTADRLRQASENGGQ